VYYFSLQRSKTDTDERFHKSNRQIYISCEEEEVLLEGALLLVPVIILLRRTIIVIINKLLQQVVKFKEVAEQLGGKNLKARKDLYILRRSKAGNVNT